MPFFTPSVADIQYEPWQNKITFSDIISVHAAAPDALGAHDSNEMSAYLNK